MHSKKITVKQCPLLLQIIKKNNHVYEKQLPAAVESKKQLVDMTRMCLQFHLLPGLFIISRLFFS